MVKKMTVEQKNKASAFRQWLIKEKNIEPTYLLAFGTKSTIMSYRRQYRKWKKEHGGNK